jgi:hypothetical protein
MKRKWPTNIRLYIRQQREAKKREKIKIKSYVQQQKNYKLKESENEDSP